MNDEEKFRFPLHMKPGFGDKYDKDVVIGSPMRYTLNDDVILMGIVVDWTDGPDGGVELTIEAPFNPQEFQSDESA